MCLFYPWLDSQNASAQPLPPCHESVQSIWQKNDKDLIYICINTTIVSSLVWKKLHDFLMCFWGKIWGKVRLIILDKANSY